MSTSREFVEELRLSLPMSALREYGPVEREILARQMDSVEMTHYPDLVGDPNGERADGSMECEVCGKLYFDHPSDWRVIGYGNVPFLTVLCDGRRVKL